MKPGGGFLLILFIFSIIFTSCGKNERSFQSFHLDLLGETPAGLTPSGSLQVWGTTQKPEKNGHIYDFMDGPGEIYVRHGFIALANRNYRDSAGRAVSAEIYRMENPDSTAALFADSLLRTDEEHPLAVGSKGIYYNPAPNYIIEYFRDRYYVRAATDNDYAKATVIALAKKIDDKIKNQ